MTRNPSSGPSSPDSAENPRAPPPSPAEQILQGSVASGSGPVSPTVQTIDRGQQSSQSSLSSLQKSSHSTDSSDSSATTTTTTTMQAQGQGQGGQTQAQAAPTKPLFGAVSGQVVWIGGPPLVDWSNTSSTSPESPLCYRIQNDPESERKGYKARVSDGNATKFKRDDPTYPLMSFLDDCLNHAQQHGWDSVFYMTGVNPNTGEGGQELFTHHSKYTLEDVQTFVREQSQAGGSFRYDKYCIEALKESGQYLANSLDETLKASLRIQLLK